MIRRSVGPSADLAACELDGETRLPDPSRAGQRHQPGAAQRLADAFELAARPINDVRSTGALCPGELGRSGVSAMDVAITRPIITHRPQR
jgi:hypothetical protein